MNKKKIVRSAMFPALLLLVGCMPKMTKEDLKNMKPQRPAELDRLDMFIGKWETNADMKMAGMDEMMQGKGVAENTWDCDKYVVVGRETYEMGEMGTMYAISTWTWDDKANKYRSTWADSFGGSGTGTAKYDEDTNTWHMKGKGRTPHGSTKNGGTAHLVDDKTMEWKFKEYAMLGPIPIVKVFDMSGTSRKK